jgi:hypothetical protein
MTQATRRVFISYSRDDTSHAQVLYKHLRVFELAHGGQVFYDQARIKAGKDWAEVLHEGIEQADLFVLLISASFTASTFCREKEARRAYERRRETGGAVEVFWVLLGDGDHAAFQPDPLTPQLGAFQAAAPLDAQGRLTTPINQLQHPDSAWRDVAAKVRRHFGVPDFPDALHSYMVDPDVSQLAARCDRDDVVKALRRLVLQGDRALLGLACVAAQVPDKVPVDRFADDLRRPEGDSEGWPTAIVHLLEGQPETAAEFTAALCRNVHDPARRDPPRHFDDLCAWLRGQNTRLLLVVHYIECDGGSASRAARDLELMVSWLAALPALPCKMLVIPVLRHEAPPAMDASPAWWRRLLPKYEAKDPLEVSRSAWEMCIRQLPAAAPSELLVLKDYPPRDVRAWRDLRDVRQALARRASAVDRAIEAYIVQPTRTYAGLRDIINDALFPPT